jgi:hypothetical protein
MAESAESVSGALGRLVLSQNGREILSLGRKGVVVCGVLLAATMVTSTPRHLVQTRWARLERTLAVCGAERQECRDRETAQQE